LSAHLAHRGICVADLARSADFYAQLGFAAGALQHLEGAAVSATYGCPEVDLRTQRCTDRDGVVLALQQFQRPGATGTAGRRPNNQFGLTHLAWYVEDVADTAAALERAGGAAHWHTRAVYPEGGAEMMYCTDPDGTRVELMYAAAATPRFSHSGICVPALDGPQRFYRELFGFGAAECYELHAHSSWLDVINELKDVKLTAQMVRDSRQNTLELLDITSPPCVGPLAPPPLNQLGLTHLAFYVEDLVATLAAVQMAGGTVDGAPRCRQYGCDSAFCTDLNGVPLLLLQIDGRTP
jgi:catechol 2,3-dioxygenase-like lactoylglutathione lyase family enzyme